MKLAAVQVGIYWQAQMSERAEDFMDTWLEAKLTDRHRKKAGVPIEELEEAVVDLEQAITDELTVAVPKGSTA